MKTRTIENILIPTGMAGALVYLFHTMFGARLWPDYNAVTTDISTLTATGSPNADLLRIFTLVYGVLMILFATGMLIRALRTYNRTLKAGFIVLLGMQIVSFVGYTLFPLDKSMSVNSVNNILHIAVTGFVVIATIVFAYLIAVGYKRQQGLEKFGTFALVMAIMITVFGVFNPIAMAIGLPILGLTERLVFFSILLLLFAISNLETFTVTPYNT